MSGHAQVGSTSCEHGFVMSTSASDEGAKRRGFESGVQDHMQGGMALGLGRCAGSWSQLCKMMESGVDLHTFSGV